MLSPYHHVFKNVPEAVASLGWDLLREGSEVIPRGFKTLELHPVLMEIQNPTKAIIENPHRKMNYSFMAMEPIWILSGSDEPWILNHLKNLDRFTDIVDGKKRLMGAYGPRIRKRFGIDQLQYVIDTLKRDPCSRQATIVIADPSTDTKGYRDVACTQWIQFMIRRSRVDMTVLMRSNDIWLGFCYDSYMFSLLLHIVASVLKLPVGSYFHIANSFHLYETDIPKLKQYLDYPRATIPTGVPPLSEVKYDSLDQVYQDVSYGEHLLDSKQLPPNDRYISRLLKMVLEKAIKVQVQK